jgi:hypothetical protein
MLAVVSLVSIINNNEARYGAGEKKIFLIPFLFSMTWKSTYRYCLINNILVHLVTGSFLAVVLLEWTMPQRVKICDHSTIKLFS